MRRLRSRAAATAIIAGTAVALAGVSGGAMAATPRQATPGAAAVARVTWHKLTLLNGWKADATDTGAPSWAVKNGIVYLSGGLSQPSPGSDVFAVLPAAARPAHNLWITVQGNDTSTFATLYITPGGQMEVYSAPASTAQFYTSLAAVSFPAAPTTSRRLTLLHGWRSSQSAWDSGAPSYRVSRGVVYLSASLHERSGGNDEFAVLPRAARPASIMYLTVYTYAGSTGVLKIFPTGQMLAYGGEAQRYASLAGLSFPAPGTRLTRLTLRNGWQSAQHGNLTGNPAYRVSGGVVYLAGSLRQPGSGTSVFATLPRAARPSHKLFIKVYTYAGSIGTVYIDPDGSMSAFTSSANLAHMFTSLAGISFPLGS